MKNALTAVTLNSMPTHVVEHPARDLVAGKPEIGAQKLANLNFGIFRTLCSLGTDQDRICAALGLNNKEFDYLLEIS
jgi:hypothetical protein